MRDIRYRAGGSEVIDPVFATVCSVHDEVFSQAPFVWTEDSSAEHAAELAQLMTVAGFRAVLCMQGDQLVGFTYGHPLPTDHGWWQGFPTALPADLVREWEGRTFALICLALRAECRGQGIGRQLIENLLAGGEEERAVLSVQPTATDTQAIYRHLGWWTAGRKGPLAGVIPPFWDIYVRDLKAPTG